MRTILLLLAGAAGLCAAQKIAGGPFVVNATPKSATVVWIVQSDEATLHPPSGAPARTSPSLRVETTTFTGLQPNTTYEYDVSGQDAGKGSFKTPPSGPGPYRFVVYGDTRTRHDVHRQGDRRDCETRFPDFVLHTGDLVADGKDGAMWPIFFDIERELLRKTAFFPSLGNHERNSHEYYDFFQVRTPYYSFNWGNAHFIVLNSDIGNVGVERVRASETFWASRRAGSRRTSPSTRRPISDSCSRIIRR